MPRPIYKMYIYRFQVSEGNMNYYFIKNKSKETLIVKFFRENDAFPDVDFEFYSKNPFNLKILEEIKITEVPSLIIKILSFLEN